MIDSVNLHILVDNMIERCKDDKYLEMRLTNFFEVSLPNMISTAKKTNEERKERKEFLEEECDKFIKRFLQKNQYYYLPYADLFIKYDKEIFTIYGEDKILHEALSSIRQGNVIYVWKNKIKNLVIKAIKKRSPLLVIPESHTIQMVINLIYPKYFPTKESAKYFLTIIGDHLRGRNDNSLIYIVDSSIKELIKNISHFSHLYCGVSNLTQNIKYRYYEYAFEKCRLLKSCDSRNPLPFLSTIKQNILDLICVSAHYSIRCNNADGFIDQCNDNELRDYTYFLSNHTGEEIAGIFIDKMIEKNVETSISSKNLLYLWKKFLIERKMPSIPLTNTLQEHFKEMLNYDEEKDNYPNITSAHLPVVSNFLTFWDVNMEKDDYGELEIGEIGALFCEWSSKMNRMLKLSGEPTEILIDLIGHFYPEIIIEESKYILGISCKLWNKQLDVINAIETFKLNLKTSNIQSKVFTLDNIYEFYSKPTKKKIVSKRYFEKYAIEIMGENIDNEGFILEDWYN